MQAVEHTHEVLKRYNKAMNCAVAWMYEDPMTSSWTKLPLLENYEMENLHKLYKVIYVTDASNYHRLT